MILDSGYKLETIWESEYKKKKKIMRDVIESGTEWIEDPVDLNLDIDKLRFETIEDLTIEEIKIKKYMIWRLKTNIIILLMDLD